MVKNTFSSELYSQYWKGMGRFVPMAMVVESADDTDAWYWKGLQECLHGISGSHGCKHEDDSLLGYCAR
jgi:hypothetical protein